VTIGFVFSITGTVRIGLVLSTDGVVTIGFVFFNGDEVVFDLGFIFDFLCGVVFFFIESPDIDLNYELTKVGVEKKGYLNTTFRGGYARCLFY